VLSTQIHNNPADDLVVDNRPRFGIGHVSVPSNDIDRMASFYSDIGMRLVVNMGRAAIVELRGGTHIVFHQGNGGTSSLDLIVDDIEETWSLLEGAGANPGPIRRGSPHDQFLATDPDGNTLVINSNHAMGPV